MKAQTVIVGGGIAGLAMAYTLKQAGQDVLVLDRSQAATGASVRNFGMVWPLGHPLGKWRGLALRSREIWLDVAARSGLWADPRGSLTLAYEELEEQVLREFLEEAKGDQTVGELISPEEAAALSPQIRQDGLRCALHSRTEVCVDPRQAVHHLAAWLIGQGVDIQFGAAVVRVSPGIVELADGRKAEAKNIVVCAGPDVRDLLPEAAQAEGLRRCSLQMMRLRPSAPQWPAMGTHLCAGLTLGHYANFRNCPSLPALRDFQATKWPRQCEWGIHVLVSQHADGSLTVGDSHLYQDDPSPFLREEVNDAILDALAEFLDVSEFEIEERWMGIYNTVPGRFCSWVQQNPGIWSLNLFGTGMTLSFGVAEEACKDVLGLTPGADLSP